MTSAGRLSEFKLLIATFKMFAMSCISKLNPKREMGHSKIKIENVFIKKIFPFLGH
jgi:hypothetical protein